MDEIQLSERERERGGVKRERARGRERVRVTVRERVRVSEPPARGTHPSAHAGRVGRRVRRGAAGPRAAPG